MRLSAKEKKMTEQIVMCDVALQFWEEGGRIHLSLPYWLGLSGPRWFARMRLKGLAVYDRKAFHSVSFNLRSDEKGVTEIAIIRSAQLPQDKRSTNDVLSLVPLQRRLHAEAACVCLEQFTEKTLAAMRLEWVMFPLRRPVKNFEEMPSYFIIHKHCNCRRTGPYLQPCSALGCVRWNDRGGFAIAA